VWSTFLILLRTGSAQALAGEIDPVRIMDEAIKARVMLIRMLDMTERGAVDGRWFEKERRQWACSIPIHGSSNGRRF